MNGDDDEDDENRRMSNMLDNLEGNSEDYEDSNMEHNELTQSYFGKLVSRASETAEQHHEK